MLEHGACLLLLFLSDKSSPASLREEAAAGKGEIKEQVSRQVIGDEGAIRNFFNCASATDLTLEPTCHAA
jgi:hypothetical protein